MGFNIRYQILRLFPIGPKISIQLRDRRGEVSQVLEGWVRPAAGGSATDFDSKAVSRVRGDMTEKGCEEWLNIMISRLGRFVPGRLVHCFKFNYRSLENRCDPW